VAGKVLVTGRDVNIRTILEFRLEQEGFTVVVSKTGPQALDQVCIEQPDLIILDLAEPHEDGLDFLVRVRSRLSHASVPIIVLSTFRKEELDSVSVELQDAKFLLKPFSPRELVADVHRIIGSKQSDTDYSERQSPT
jgi:DNA-binding response OmpR family regulator